MADAYDFPVTVSAPEHGPGISCIECGDRTNEQCHACGEPVCWECMKAAHDCDPATAERRARAAPGCGCHPDPATGWEELGWCCAECSIAAHMAWHDEYDTGTSDAAYHGTGAWLARRLRQGEIPRSYEKRYAVHECPT